MTSSRREFPRAVSAASAAGVSRLYAQAPGTDLVLFNGKIVTVDDPFSIREVIVIKDDRIMAVGGNELRRRYAGVAAGERTGRRAWLQTKEKLGGFRNVTGPYSRCRNLFERCPCAKLRSTEGEYRWQTRSCMWN